MILGTSNWNTFNKGIEKEFLLTNGLGGYCFSTVIGANIRKYHGLLNVSLNPPIERMNILSKIDETIIISDKRYPLYSNQYVGGIDEGYKTLRKFEKNPLPKFFYGVEDVEITKEISLKYGENTVAIVYDIKTGSRDVTIEFNPWVNCRNHHDNSELYGFNYKQEYNDKILNLKNELINLQIYSNVEYLAEKSWSKPIYLSNEDERGLMAIDYTFNPGIFETNIDKNTQVKVIFVASTEKDFSKDAISIINDEKVRISRLRENIKTDDEFIKELVYSADQFIVKRASLNKKTVIAGYPWFTDWGRDTMIALPGLTLSTKRFSEAKEIINTFIEYLEHGLIPNMFPDDNNKPMYNTVDGTLWLFNSVYKYYKETLDVEFIEELYPILNQIINKHIEGTINNIYMDKDYLLWAGEKGTQLTWMDVKVYGWVVTPRHGKAVEINALWYNALKIMNYFAEEIGGKPIYEELSNNVKMEFNQQFWNEELNCLYDVLQDNIKLDDIRPNQLLAISLPFSVLEKKRWKDVVSKAYRYLYTSYGMRTLNKEDKKYIGVYKGSILDRDGAYHQGTVWPYLIGSFFEAYIKANDYSKESLEWSKRSILLFKDHLLDGVVGSISEILDGDEPHYQRGCPAQAWSVAEVLRIYTNYLTNI